MSGSRKVPLRKCVGCGEMKGKKELVRILKTPAGEIVTDITGRQNGRGAYICQDEACLKKAMKNKGIERSLRVSIPAEVYERLVKEWDTFAGK